MSKASSKTRDDVIRSLWAVVETMKAETGNLGSTGTKAN
jgi:hypothetical protein